MTYTGHVELLEFEMEGNLCCITEPGFIEEKEVDNLVNEHILSSKMLPIEHHKIRFSKESIGYMTIILTKNGEYEKISRKLKSMIDIGELTYDMRTKLWIDSYEPGSNRSLFNLAMKVTDILKKDETSELKIGDISIFFITEHIDDETFMDAAAFAALIDMETNSIAENDVNYLVKQCDVYAFIMEKPTVYYYGLSDRIEI